jgi:alpha-ketoglutaric semialdehyde dehydrogenase
MSSQIFKNFIGGCWIDGSANSQNVNPGNHDEVLGQYAQGNADDVHDAVLAARSAFGRWASSSIQVRFDVLDSIGCELIARCDELGTLLSREEGKIRAEGIAEVTRAGRIFKFFAGECLRFGGEILPSVRSNIGVEITREPIGVVGIVTPWNFPVAIPAWKIAPALAFGNCVVFKPAELVPASAWALAEVISRSGLPPGVFNLVMGKGRVIGDAMVNHPGIDGMTFTGSAPVGQNIAAQCGLSQKKVQLEMGGKNPQVVLDDADLDAAVELSVQSAFFSTGQRCTASSRFIVTKGVYTKFVSAMKTRIHALQVGDALEPTTHIGPVASSSQLASNLDYVDVGKAEGATLVCGGKQVSLKTNGNYMTPALFSEASNSMRISREEIFGPVACVICVNDYEEALHVANDTPFGLSAGIATASLKYATHFKRHSQAGMVMVNLSTAGVDYHVPFGGRKSSSYGPREQGSYAKEFFTTVKTAYTHSL